MAQSRLPFVLSLGGLAAAAFSVGFVSSHLLERSARAASDMRIK